MWSLTGHFKNLGSPCECNKEPFRDFKTRSDMDQLRFVKATHLSCRVDSRDGRRRKAGLRVDGAGGGAGCWARGAGCGARGAGHSDGAGGDVTGFRSPCDLSATSRDSGVTVSPDSRTRRRKSGWFSSSFTSAWNLVFSDVLLHWLVVNLLCR